MNTRFLASLIVVAVGANAKTDYFASWQDPVRGQVCEFSVDDMKYVYQVPAVTFEINLFPKGKHMTYNVPICNSLYYESFLEPVTKTMR